MISKNSLSRPAAAIALASFIAICSFAAERNGTSPMASPRVPGATDPAALSFDVKPTVFFVRAGQGLKQLLTVSVDNGGAPTSGELAVRVNGRDISFPLNPIARGKSSFPVAIPEITQPAPVTFTLKSGGQMVRKDVSLKPQRKWSIYLFHHSHTDIGYTELQFRVTQNHVEYLDSVIDDCDATDDYPDDARFRWNIEASWTLQNFVRQRPEARVRRLVELIKAGRVELSGLYVNQSDSFSHEELIRSVDFSLEFAKKYGFEVTCAMNDDVTGFGWALPQILRQAGIKYFATGINETRSRAPLRRPCPFWWESPDGSRILHWNGEHYLFANYDLLLHEPLPKSSPKVGEYLATLETRGDYAYDLIAFNISAWVTDNCPPGRALSDRVKEWNEMFAYPKLRLATLHEFFSAMEAKYGPGLPTYRLGWPDYWTDGVASTSFETGLNRVTHNDLISAEKWSALAAWLDKGVRFPAGEIREAYEQATLYDEHTWGAYNSIDDPQSELARGQWALKSSFAYRAREASRTLLKRGTEALARLISADGEYEFAVFNLLSWARTDAVRVTLPAGPLREAKGKIRVIDRRLGSDAIFQVMGDDAILVVARNIPSMGYAVFAVRPGEGDREGVGLVPNAKEAKMVTDQAGDPVLENRFYRVTVDSKTGGIASLIDKETGRELVDKTCAWPLNTYIYEQPEGGRKAVDDMTKRAKFERWSPAETAVLADWHGPVARSFLVASAPKMCRSLEQRIILYEDVKRIDLVNVLNKEETFDPEAVYFAFPFAVGPDLRGAFSNELGAIMPAAKSREIHPLAAALPGPNVRFEISDADMTPGIEQLPGTTLDWHTAQHWVEFSGKDARVIWSPIEAPLVQFGDINTGKWLKKLELTNAWVFSYAMNNYWMTNFKASQEGRVEFRYSLTSLPPAPPLTGGPVSAAGSDRVISSRFGWEVHTPLAAVWLPPKNEGLFTAPFESLISVDRPNVIIQALWLDPDGTPVARLREIAGQATEARVLSAVFLGFTTRRSGALGQTEVGSIPVSLKPFEIRTLRVAIGN
jgi:alpha-mannosidase